MKPETETPEDEVVLDVTKIVNHPGYDAAKGPIAGNDIAVYLVNEANWPGKLERWKIYPACLPRPSYRKRLSGDSKAHLAGWTDPKPIYKIMDSTTTLRDYQFNLYPNQVTQITADWFELFVFSY